MIENFKNIISILSTEEGQASLEAQKAIERFEEIIDDLESALSIADPLLVGRMVLELAGYSVDFRDRGSNSLKWTVSENGEIINAGYIGGRS